MGPLIDFRKDQSPLFPDLCVPLIFAILKPPIHSIIKRHDSLLDKVGILGSELFRVVAGNDTEEGKVILYILAPMVLKYTKTEDIVKLSLCLW